MFHSGEKMTEFPLFQVDAFTARPFSGNPAGVCLLSRAAPDGWMKALAAEMNLSETAFLLEEDEGYRLRWFTPAVEVRLCGHATLAASHILWETGILKPDQPARFFTLSGSLTARREGGWIELNFPADPPETVEMPEGLEKALGARPLAAARCRSFLLAEFASLDEVRALAPDFAALKPFDPQGVIVTAAGNGAGYDFVSRFFAPNLGIDEDPVTGSAHCCLAPYWAEKLGKPSLHAFQVSRRGGELKVRLEGQRVAISGQAVTIFQTRVSAP